MPKKEDFLVKLNMKDYNNQLEEILEKKNFSSDTKNFLLSMLYKIENAYNDYFIVKNIQKGKREFIEEVIQIIDKDCEKIDLIKPLDKEYSKIQNKKERCIVNKIDKSIICAYNEQNLLYAIFQLQNKNYKFKNDILKNPLEELLNNGEAINAKEVIRDFDGWAWHTEVRLIENIEYNIVYQNILLLIGDGLKTESDIKSRLARIYNREKAKEIYILICKIAILMYVDNNNKDKKNYKALLLELKQNYKEMENKEEYLKEFNIKIKNIESRISIIDKCLSDVNLLKKEYIKTNKKLEEDKKIFSISDFVDKIQKEKNELICELKKYKNKMKPENYIREKEVTKELLNIFEVLNTKLNIYDFILKLQENFILGIQEKIKQVQTRKDIMDIIYKWRYYKFIPYKEIKIKNVKEIQESICKTEEMIYNIASKMNTLNTISINNKINNEVISKILDIEMVELENVEVLIKAQNYQIELQIYDDDNIEKALQYDTIEGLVARVNRKFRLFIK